MTDHADTIRLVLNGTLDDPHGKALRALDALLAENSRLNVSEAEWAARALEAETELQQAEAVAAQAARERQQAQYNYERESAEHEITLEKIEALRAERQQAIDALRMAKPYIARYGSVEEFDLLANAIGEQP